MYSGIFYAVFFRPNNSDFQFNSDFRLDEK